MSKPFSPLPGQGELKEYFDYDPKTGYIRRIKKSDRKSQPGRIRARNQSNKESTIITNKGTNYNAQRIISRGDQMRQTIGHRYLDLT